MITFKLNGKSIQVPSSWNDVTFAQYLKIFDVKDDVIQLVSILTGVEYDYLKSAEIIGLDKLLEAISFTNTQIKFPDQVDYCGPYKIEANSVSKDKKTKGRKEYNPQYESLGQFEDARKIMNSLDGNIKAHTEAYGKYVAIYLQKIKDKSYDPQKVEEVEKELQNYPAFQVITLGSFFFVKLKILFGGIPRTSLPTPPTRKKLKRVLKPSKRSSGATRK